MSGHATRVDDSFIVADVCRFANSGRTCDDSCFRKRSIVMELGGAGSQVWCLSESLHQGEATERQKPTAAAFPSQLSGYKCTFTNVVFTQLTAKATGVSVRMSDSAT